MYKTHQLVMEELSSYSSPKSKLTKMIRNREIIQIKRGIFLHTNDHNYSKFSLASIVYGPSYISFESALSFYGMIPEEVKGITSAIYDKNKNKSFHTPIGDFYYFSLPKEVYPLEIVRLEDESQGYLIATPEKALLDVIYKTANLRKVGDLEEFLFEDKRIDQERISRLNLRIIRKISPLYNKSQCLLLTKVYEKYYA